MAETTAIGERAFEIHNPPGFHCAEAVCLALWEAYGNSGPAMLPRAASAFGGGIGRSHQEICGALSGGLLALGLLCGRDRPDQSWDKAAKMASSLMDGFLARHGHINCSELLESFGPGEALPKCRRLSRDVARMVAEMIEEQCPA